MAAASVVGKFGRPRPRSEGTSVKSEAVLVPPARVSVPDAVRSCGQWSPLISSPDDEVVCRANLPKGCLETIRVVDITR